MAKVVSLVEYWGALAKSCCSIDRELNEAIVLGFFTLVRCRMKKGLCS